MSVMGQSSYADSVAYSGSGTSSARGRRGLWIGRGQLRRRRLHDQHGARALPHDLLGLAAPEEPADATTAVAAHHEENALAEFTNLFFQQVICFRLSHA